MDIQISSNFERLLFEAGGRDAAGIRRAFARLKQSGAFTLDEGTLTRIRAEFDAGRASVAEAAETIRATLADNAYLLDPHTACAVHVAERFASTDTPMVVLATAHPAKFPAAVEAACGVRPALPAWLADLMSREERYGRLPSDLKMVEEYVGERARAAQDA